jgi:hypothetical protein
MGPRRRKTIVVRATQWSAGAFMVLALLMSIISGRVQQAKAPERVAEEDVETSPLSELEHLGEEYEDGAEGDGLAPPAGVQDPPVPAEDPVEAPELLEPEMSPDEAEAEAAESETPLEDESAPEDEAEAASESGAAGAGGEGR